MSMIDSILNIDHVKLCDYCRGLGFILIKDFDTLEPIQKVCTKCEGSGRLRVSGVLKVEPLKLNIPVTNLRLKQN